MAEKNNEHVGHRARMLSKFSEYNINVFEEHEMLEVLLFMIIPRVNTNETAHRVINEFGSLKNALLAPVNELAEINGIGEKSAIQLRFVGELANYLNRTQATVKYIFDESNKIIKYFTNHFKNKNTEALTVLLLDDNSVFLHSHEICSNMPNHVDVGFREIVSQAMKYDARKLLIAHNHIVGTKEPSNDDLRFTRELYDFLKAIKVELVDHIIVSNGEVFSMRDSGCLGRIWDS